MAKEKEDEKRPKWFQIVLGLCFLLVIFRPADKAITAAELSPLTLTAVADIDLIKGAKSEYTFRIRAKEHEAAFVIRKPGELASISWDSLNNIKKGDRLQVQIAASRLEDLNRKIANIPVYELRKNGLQFYDLETYNKAKTRLTQRWNYLFALAGIICLLRGFSLVSGQTSVILFAVFLAVLLWVV